MTVLLLWFVSGSFGQGASMSPYDLKESFFEKRASYKRSGTKFITAENQAELDRLTMLLEENAPDSYEYHLVKYANSNYGLAEKEHLFEAYKLKPDDRRVQEEMFGYYVITGDQSGQKKLAGQLKKYYGKNVLDYYATLASDPEIKVLFLSGQEDAVPALILQNTGRISTNITVVNLDYLQSDVYRKRIQSQIGMSNVPFRSGTEATFVATALSAQKSGAFIATTVSQNFIREPADHTFLTGLSYQYHCNNQYDKLVTFWLNAKESLAKIDFDSRSERDLYTNYLPPLLTLYKLKIASGEKDAVLRMGIVLLSEKLRKKEDVEKILKAYEQIE